jgi:very-short-patch-repair endonuclease
MSYKRHMSPAVSNGELALFAALSSANLTYGMVTQKPVILKFSVPDFCWPLKKKAVYLDGVQVHRKAHVERRDEEINELMELRGWDILRIPYEPPLSPTEARQIVEQIREFIGEY